MRLPIPERFQIKHVLVFASTVFLVQQVEGTDIVFSALTFLFFFLYALAFNAGGGLMYASGAWVFFNGLSTAALGITYKLLLNERGESHLVDPNRTMSIYCMGMAGVGVAAWLSHRLLRKRGLLTNFLTGDRLRQAAIGCMIAGSALGMISIGNYNDSGSITSIIRQLNQFTRMAIILGTTYAIVSSRGKKSTNWIVWVTGATVLFGGIVNFSKEGMFVAPITWLIPAVALGFNFSKKQVFGALVVAWFMLYYLVPFSQLGRNARVEDREGTLTAALPYLLDLRGTRKLYLEGEADQDNSEDLNFYDTPQGLFDREQMLSVDNALINYSDKTNSGDLQPTLGAFANVVPHFIWKDKPTLTTGNDYARELGIVAPDDTTTGIAFSPVGDAYHQASWLGPLLLLPFIAFLYFIVTDTLVGSVRESPWPLLAIAMASHAAAEGGIGGTIYLFTFGTLAIVMIAFTTRYVMPLFFGLLGGKSGPQTRSTVNPLSSVPQTETLPSGLPRTIAS